MKKAAQYKEKKKMWIILAMILVCFATAICIILPPSFGKTKPLSDENGKVIEGSIS